MFDELLEAPPLERPIFEIFLINIIIIDYLYNTWYSVTIKLFSLSIAVFPYWINKCFPFSPIQKELFPFSFFRSIKKKLAFHFFVFIWFPFRLFHFEVLFLHWSELWRYFCLIFPCSTLQSYFLVHLNREKASSCFVLLYLTL